MVTTIMNKPPAADKTSRMSKLAFDLTILDLDRIFELALAPPMTQVTQHAEYFSSQVTNTRRFFHPEWKRRAQKSSALCVVGGGCEWCAPDFVVDRRRFPFVAFEFVWRGQGSVQLGEKTHPLAGGHAFFFDQRMPHIIRSEGREPLVKYFFNFAGARILHLLKELRLSPGTVLRVADPARIAGLLEEALDHALKGAELGDRATAAALEHALVLCAEQRLPEAAEFEPAHGTYLRCRDHLLRNYPLLPTVGDAARQCGVSAAYMTRLFKRFGSETPHNCLQRLKLSQALLKLRQQDAQVKNIAAEVGYKSAAHFSRAFKAWHGAAPQSMRGA